MGQGSKISPTSFALDAEDLARIERIRVALAMQGMILNRTEIVRLALLALNAAPPAVARKWVPDLPRRTPGRPKGHG